MAAPKRPAGAKSDKLWRSAIQRAVHRRLEGKAGPQALDMLADKTVECALAGEGWAIKEIGDRLDGKAVQPISGPEGEPLAAPVFNLGFDTPK